VYRPLSFLALATAVTALCVPALTAQKRSVKVFILAGQSNMEGKVQQPLLDHQATDPKTKALFAHLRKGDEWIVRDDVFIKYLKRKGPLTVGYGSPGRTGAELEFGWVMGDHFKEPVLLPFLRPAPMCYAYREWGAPIFCWWGCRRIG
jgi:alpha-galactosidase